MAYIFTDGFDCYAAPADAVAGYWDSGTVTSVTFQAGRFSGSQSVCINTASSTTAALIKNSGSNDPIHHIGFAVNQTNALSGTSAQAWFTFGDGATAQCSVIVRSDGAIVLTSGNAAGTALATYTGALTASNTWYQFEVEVRVSNTAGYMIVRKLGNTSNDFASATNLDTSANANDYANRLSMGAVGGADFLDDFLWRSDSVANGVAWAGDIRCQTRRPASDAAVQWSRSGTGSLVQSVTPGTQSSGGLSGNAYYTAFTAAYDGTVNSVSVVYFSLGTTTSMKCAIFSSVGGLPGAVLASATAIVTPVVVGNNVFTFSPGVPVVRGTQYWVGACRDGNGSFTMSSATQAVGANGTVALATFPQASPVVSNPSLTVYMSWTFALPASNAALVRELQQDAAGTYVYSSNVGDSDLYAIEAIATTPASIVAVTTRGYLQKSDAGTRNTAVQLKSASTTVTSGAPLTYSPTALNPSDLLNVTLSGSNLIATASGSPSAVRGTTGLSAGKFYCEFTYNSPQSVTCGGLATSTASLASLGGGGATGSIQCFAGFAIWVNGSSSGTSLGSISSGQVVGMAVDLTAKLIWFRIAPSGNWNASGTADPATGAGGISYSVLGAGLLTLYPAIGLGGPSAQIVANFGATAFTGAVPSGFASGFGSTITGGGAALNTTFGWQYLTNTTDPATGAAWTAVGVNNAQVGVVVTA